MHLGGWGVLAILLALWRVACIRWGAMPRVIPNMDVNNTVGELQDVGNGVLYVPRVSPTRGVVACTYEQMVQAIQPLYCLVPNCVVPCYCLRNAPFLLYHCY